VKLRDRNVLITGGAGFIGSHLVERVIADEPSNLVVVDNFFLGSEENLSQARALRPDLKVYRLDASSLASMRELAAVERIEVVFNLAVIPLPTSLHYPHWTMNTNIQIATAFCELARWGAIETLIHVSSSEAYGSLQFLPMDETHPLLARTPYAASKAACDQMVLSYHRTFGIDAAIARPFNNFGPRQNAGSYAGVIPIVVRRVADGEPVEIFGDGEQTRDYIYVGKTADALVRIYEQEATRGKVLNVATGHEISINSLIERMLKLMGVPEYPVVHTAPRPGDVRRHCGGIELAKQLIGLQGAPLTDAELAETITYYQDRLR
jgi:UDP-glucose 4-epimerase